MKPRQHPVSVALFVIIIFAATGCTTEHREQQDQAVAASDSTTSELYGDVYFPDADCSQPEINLLSRAIRYGRIAAASELFRSCMEREIKSSYMPCYGEPFFEASDEQKLAGIMNIMNSDNTIRIRCSGAAPGVLASAWPAAYGNDYAEAMTFNQAELLATYAGTDKPYCQSGATSNTLDCRTLGPTTTIAGVAGVIWHEASHRHSYSHGANTETQARIRCGYGGNGRYHFQRHSMPYIVNRCMAWTLDRSLSTCGPGLERCGDRGLKLASHTDPTNPSSCTCHYDPSVDRTYQVAVRGGVGSIPYLGQQIFAHYATEENTTGAVTVLDHNEINSDRNKVVLVTMAYDQSQLSYAPQYNAHNISVQYNPVIQRYVIFNADGAPIVPGMRFNVLVGNDTETTRKLTVNQRSAFTDFGFQLEDTYFNFPNANEAIFLTHNHTPLAGEHNYFNGNLLTEWRPAGSAIQRPWVASRSDSLRMEAGTTFNVLQVSSGKDNAVVTHVSSDWSNVELNTLVIDHPELNGRPEAILFAQQRFAPAANGITAQVNDHPVGVWYNHGLQKWTVFNQDLAAMPLGVGYDIAGFLPIVSTTVPTDLVGGAL